MAERLDNLLMWAHYGEEHRGFVVGFNSSHTFFDQRKNQKDSFRHIRKVRYRKIRPTIRISSDEDLSRILLTKSIHWNYERESRMLLPLQDASDVRSDGINPPVHLFDFPPQAVAEIIIGCRMPSALEEELATYLFGEPECKHVQVFVAEMDRQEFKLNLVRLSSNDRKVFPRKRMHS
jgi:hypothetical protein